MSIAALKAAAESQPDGDYILIDAETLAAALTEAGEQPTKGSLLELCRQRVDIAKGRVAMNITDTPNPKMQVHRVAHVGKLLGVKGSGTTTPAAPAAQTGAASPAPKPQ